MGGSRVSSELRVFRAIYGGMLFYFVVLPSAYARHPDRSGRICSPQRTTLSVTALQVKQGAAHGRRAFLLRVADEKGQTAMREPR